MPPHSQFGFCTHSLVPLVRGTTRRQIIMVHIYGALYILKRNDMRDRVCDHVSTSSHETAVHRHCTGKCLVPAVHISLSKDNTLGGCDTTQYDIQCY